MNNYGKRTLQVFGCIGLVLSMTSIAQASAIEVTSPFTGNDSIDWGNYGSGLGSSVTSGSTTLTADSQTVVISFSDGDPGVIFQENPSTGTYNFQGGFATGPSPYLLNTSDSSLNVDSLTLAFTTPVSEFGVYIEEFDYNNAFSATLSTPSDGGASFTVGPASGSPQWIGVAESGGVNDITSITLTTSGADSDFFLIGTAELQYGPLAPPSVSTPEPASLMMLGSALVALVWKLRRRNRA